MEQLTHRFVHTNGIKMHYVEKGTGTVVLLLHGFPQTWYTWRHQIPPLVDAGFRVIAPDLRGYGKTEAPVGVEKYTALHIVGDLIGLLDSLGAQQAFVVGHDWGAIIAWYLSLFRPDRVIALVNLSVHFIPRTPAGSILQQVRTAVGESHYICRFQEPGKIEEMIAKETPLSYLRTIFLHQSAATKNQPPHAPENGALPSWISEEEVRVYASDFEKSGFTGPLNYYRALDLTWELMAPWANGKVTVPTLFIVGDKDITYDFPGAKDYIHKGGMQADVPNLRDVIILEGVYHFLHEEKPAVVTEKMLNFVRSFHSKI